MQTIDATGVCVQLLFFSSSLLPYRFFLSSSFPFVSIDRTTMIDRKVRDANFNERTTLVQTIENSAYPFLRSGTPRTASNHDVHELLSCQDFDARLAYFRVSFFLISNIAHGSGTAKNRTRNRSSFGEESRRWKARAKMKGNAIDGSDSCKCIDSSFEQTFEFWVSKDSRRFSRTFD